MRSSDSMFHRFYSTRKCFQQRLICFNTKRMLPAGENKCCRQTVLHISFCSFLSESDNLFISTWFRDKSRFHGITQLSFWAYTFASKLQFSFQILSTSEIFCKMEKFPFSKLLLLGWAKPFSFWAKRFGRNSLWAKLAIFDKNKLTDI